MREAAEEDASTLAQGSRFRGLALFFCSNGRVVPNWIANSPSETIPFLGCSIVRPATKLAVSACSNSARNRSGCRNDLALSFANAASIPAIPAPYRSGHQSAYA